MSPELVAALVGALAGGLIALFGGIAQAFIQGWISERGKITCDAVAWRFVFEYYLQAPRPNITEPLFEGTAKIPWEVARTYTAEPSPVDAQQLAMESFERYDDSKTYFAYANSASFDFTVNFLNTKGTNTAVLEYSVQFLRGRQAVITMTPAVSSLSSIGEAINLPAETVTGVSMFDHFNRQQSEKVLREADRAEFTARLSSGPPIRLELEHLSQDLKGAQKGDAT
jgi:hypothetical protein